MPQVSGFSFFDTSKNVSSQVVRDHNDHRVAARSDPFVRGGLIYLESWLQVENNPLRESTQLLRVARKLPLALPLLRLVDSR